MIGLTAIIVIGVLLALALWAYAWAYRLARRKGKSEAAAFGWGIGAVFLFSLPITWDAIPTWIAFDYYAKKEAGITVFKTLEQWKAENPGVAETLVPYAVNDKRGELKNLGGNKFRHPLNDRFAYDSITREKLFLSIYAHRYELIDVKKKEILVRYVKVGSGNSGGIASGGEGWWAFWLINEPKMDGENIWSESVHAVEKMGVKK